MFVLVALLFSSILRVFALLLDVSGGSLLSTNEKTKYNQFILSVTFIRQFSPLPFVAESPFLRSTSLELS